MQMPTGILPLVGSEAEKGGVRGLGIGGKGTGTLGRHREKKEREMIGKTRRWEKGENDKRDLRTSGKK